MRSAAPAIQGGGQADQRNRLSLIHMREFIIADQTDLDTLKPQSTDSEATTPTIRLSRSKPREVKCRGLPGWLAGFLNGRLLDEDVVRLNAQIVVQRVRRRVSDDTFEWDLRRGSWIYNLSNAPSEQK